MDLDASSLAYALVREYLSRKGLSSVLSLLEAQNVSVQHRVGSRSDLSKALRLEKAVRRNKEAPQPLGTMLELLVAKQTDKARARDKGGDHDGGDGPKTSSSSSSSTYSPSSGRPFARAASSTAPSAKQLGAASSRDFSTTLGRSPSLGAAPSNEGSPIRSLSSSLSTSFTRRLEEDRRGDAATSTSLSSTARSGRRGSAKRTGSKAATRTDATMLVEDLEVDDMDDLDFGHKTLVLSRGQQLGGALVTGASAVGRGKAISVSTASALRQLVFGTKDGTFNAEWLRQGFVFNQDHPDLSYGLVQHKGGPCGVLAVVQGFIIKHLFFVGHAGVIADRSRVPRTSEKQRSAALLEALADIIWRCGDGSHSVVAVPSLKAANTRPGYKPDGLTEKMMLYSCSTLDELRSTIKSNLAFFVGDPTSGVISLLYSAILSRSIERIREDRDEPESRLMGQHSYCSLDMVNLLITGRASTNVHDGIVTLGEGPDASYLKGVRGPCDIGLVTLYEHYKSCKVGERLKRPTYPIWVVNSESHFSIMFNLNPNLDDSTTRFDIHYYDELGKQQEAYVLTVDTSRRVRPAGQEKMVSPIEHCIRTRWPACAVDWNGSDPLY
eukprot:m.323096 g.323096  ORF g.323096 m.323096 type:complete len:609 (+) comp19722_c1_seq3:13-1839(+)